MQIDSIVNSIAEYVDKEVKINCHLVMQKTNERIEGEPYNGRFFYLCSHILTSPAQDFKDKIIISRSKEDVRHLLNKFPNAFSRENVASLQVEITGTVVKTMINGFSLGIENIKQIIVEEKHCTIYLSPEKMNLLSFYSGHESIIRLNDLLLNTTNYRDKTVQIVGKLVGLGYRKNNSSLYFVSSDSYVNKKEKGILLLSKDIREKLLEVMSPMVGGNITYIYNSHAVGEIEEINISPFTVGISKIRHIAIELDNKISLINI